MSQSMKEAKQLKVADGKVSMSLFELEHFLDYEKYERNLKIVRER